jgi:hypothetical protein
MNIATPDALHRLVKLAMDTGEAESVEHAQRIFAGYRIGVAVGPEIETSPTHQAALLTLLRLASRAFLGGVDVVMQSGAEIPNLIPGLPSIDETIVACGAKRVNSLESYVPAVCIGTVEVLNAACFAVRAVFSGWRAGVVPADADVPFAFDTEFTLSGALAAALAVNEVFLFVRHDTPEAGLRELGLSLWKLDAIDDWWRPENDGPALRYLPSRLWLIGLGHLGQAYLWGLALMPYAQPTEVELVLQDVDIVSASTPSTSILSEAGMVGECKTRAMAAQMERRGFRTSIVERRFDEAFHVRTDEPQVALFGVDNALARRALGEVGFKLVVEAGLGSGAKDFRAIRVHTFPGPKDPRDLWGAPAREVANADTRAYAHLKSLGLDQCGVTLLAGKAVGAPFVGMTAAMLCLSELLRLLHGGDVIAVHDIDLKSPMNRVSVLNSNQFAHFNPGYTAVRRLT